VPKAGWPADFLLTCESWLVQAGLSLYEVGAQLGHGDLKSAQRYARLAPDRHDRVVAAKRPATGMAARLVRHNARTA
jgi:hypothetical protein